MITRRQFLKRIGTVCAAVVVAPATLVKTKPKIVRVIDENGLLSCRDTSGRWRNYYADYTKENEDALSAMRRVSALHRAIVKRARQKQIQYEKTNKSR